MSCAPAERIDGVGRTRPRVVRRATFLFAAISLVALLASPEHRFPVTAAARARRSPFSRRDAAALRQLGLMDPAADSEPAAGALAYMPAYAIPVGAPVDPCATCRPRRTTMCRKNAKPCDRAPQPPPPATARAAEKSRDSASTEVAAAATADDDDDQGDDQPD